MTHRRPAVHRLMKSSLSLSVGVPFLERLRRSVSPVATIALGCTLAACAALPSTSQQVQPTEVGQYATTASFSAPATQWPEARWWQRYGDSQLDELITGGLRDAPDMAVAAARLRAAESAARVAGSVLSPQLSASASVSEQKQSYHYLSPVSATPQGWNDYGRAALDFSWEIDFWGRNRAALAAATSELEASRADAAQAQLTLSTAIASTYAELARLFEDRDTVLKAIEIRVKTSELFKQRFSNGMETRGGLAETEARRAAAEGNLLQIDEEIERQRYRLAALMGAGPDRGRTIRRPSIKLDQAFGLPSQIAVNLLGRRPDLVAARLQAAAQAHRVEQTEAAFYPNINLAAFIGVQSLGLDLLTRSGSSIGSVGPAISLPIFNGGRLRGELRGAQARYAQAVALYNRTVAQALQEVAEAALGQRSLVPQLDKASKAVSAASEAHTVARRRYEGGLSSYLEVLSAEDALVANLRTLTDLRARSFALDVALMRALGGGYQHSMN